MTGIYTADMGQPPQDIDGASVTPGPKKPMAKKPAPAPAVKKPAPKGSGVFREGMPVPQDIDGASAKPYKKGGSVGSASRRADGIARQGKTKGRML